MYVTRHIDWLSFSIPTEVHPSTIFPLLGWVFVGRGQHGYASAFLSKTTSAVAQTDSNQVNMGTTFRFSGDALDRLRSDFGADDTALCAMLARNKAKASRIDLTLNIHEGTLTPLKVCQAVRSGSAKPKANVSRLIQGKNGDVEGDTFYIGSPTSDRQFRAYNKSAELGIVDGQAWLRLELELRRVRADGAFKSCALNGVDATVSGHMGDFLNWGNVEYQAALGQKAVPPVDIPRRNTNRQRWLLGQVAQALAKEICIDEDFALKFWSSVGEEVANLKSQE